MGGEAHLSRDASGERGPGDPVRAPPQAWHRGAGARAIAGEGKLAAGGAFLALEHHAAHRVRIGWVADPVEHHLGNGALTRLGFHRAFVIDRLGETGLGPQRARSIAVLGDKRRGGGGSEDAGGGELVGEDGRNGKGWAQRRTRHARCDACRLTVIERNKRHRQQHRRERPANPPHHHSARVLPPTGDRNGGAVGKGRFSRHGVSSLLAALRHCGGLVGRGAARTAAQGARPPPAARRGCASVLSGSP